jgi:hypothetical protein
MQRRAAWLVDQPVSERFYGTKGVRFLPAAHPIEHPLDHPNRYGMGLRPEPGP